MKKENRVRAKTSAAKVPAQAKRHAGKSSSAERATVNVALTKPLASALAREMSRTGHTRDEIFEQAVRRELAKAPKVRPIKVLFSEPVIAALNLVVGNNPLKREEFIRQAICEKLQRVGKGGAR